LRWWTEEILWEKPGELVSTKKQWKEDAVLLVMLRWDMQLGGFPDFVRIMDKADFDAI
jgi:hypothetical protein